MGFNLHASGTSDPKEVRNWKIHLIAIVASMSAIASEWTRETHLSYSVLI